MPHASGIPDLVTTDASLNDTLNIPIPFKLEHRRGLRSLRSSGRPLAVRLHEDDIAMLDELVAATGVERGALMRWFIVWAGKALYKKQTGKDVEITP